MSVEQKSDLRNFEFTGSAKEWFGIWIVNLFFSIITFGIYSAWAKVRAKKYFYSNTHLDGRHFDYHATGGQILKGRLIVIAAIVGFNIIMPLSQVWGAILLFALLVSYPGLLMRAIMFRARVTSFSNIRFSFDEKDWEAFKVYLIYPFLCILTIYTTFPITNRALSRFSINNHRLGIATFEMNTKISAFYKAAGFAFLWIIIVCTITFFTKGLFAEFDSYSALKNISLGAFYAVFLFGFIPAAIIYKAFTRNAIFNGTSLEGGYLLRSNVNALQLIWITVSNLLIVLFTVGLMLPWAQIRMAHYLAKHTAVELGGSIDDFVGVQQEATTAIGDAYSDIEGLDVGLTV
jgi:uncharacterized membrane protein YjgN (DUF898 family)